MLLTIYVYAQPSAMRDGWPIWFLVETQNGNGFRRIDGTYQWPELCAKLRATADPVRVILR